jgi:hypothetical protein
METLKINIPKGYEVDSFDTSTGEIKFREKPKHIMERIRTVDDIFEYHDISSDDVALQFTDVPEHLKYQYIAELLCQALNEGWKPDWSDNNEYKYLPWFELAGSSGFRFYDYDGWRTTSAVGSRLCLKSADLAQYAGEQFTDLYKKFML